MRVRFRRATHTIARRGLQIVPGRVVALTAFARPGRFANDVLDSFEAIVCTVNLQTARVAAGMRILNHAPAFDAPARFVEQQNLAARRTQPALKRTRVNGKNLSHARIQARRAGRTQNPRGPRISK